MFKKELITKAILDKGWSKYKLCKEAGLAQSTLSDILTGKNTNPRMDTIQKIASALEVSVDTFFDDKNTENENITKKKIDSRIQPIIDSLDRAGDLKDEDINEISQQVEFLINLKRQKK